MVQISPDVGKNRVVLEFTGRVSAQHLQEAAQRAPAVVSRLRPPFDVLSDIRKLEGLESVDAGMQQAFRELAQSLMPSGIRRVVRVVGKSAQAAVQIEKLARAVEDHAAHLAFSLEEAEQVLK